MIIAMIQIMIHLMATIIYVTFHMNLKLIKYRMYVASQSFHMDAVVKIITLQKTLIITRE